MKPITSLVRRAAAAATLAAASLGPAQAAVVEVAYIQPERFSDVRDMRYRMEDDLKQLTLAFRQLGERYLAADQRLEVEVLDIDLAGFSTPRTTPYDIRILNGGADAPRIKLRYTLETTGAPIRQGEETLTDLDYQRLTTQISRRDTDPLFYEKRLIENWIRTRFAGKGEIR